MPNTRAEDTPPRTVPNWGRFVDPDGDCQASLAGGKLIMTVAGALHDLNKRNAMNAPRVVQDVAGDFEITVKVTGYFTPGEESAVAGGLRFNSAGLLVYQNDDNYIRLERNAMVVGTQTYCFPPLCEIFAEGKYRGINRQATAEAYFQGKSTWLRIKRAGDYFKPAVSHDGQTWEELPRVEVVLADRLQVGVAAVNTTTTPHSVTFEELKLKLSL
jgi:regulation of enolase protein 1 (concanavalin A-like superfamily)